MTKIFYKFEQLYILARADALERMRRYSYLITLVASLYLAYNVLAGNIVMAAGHYRGIYNSAWLGALTAVSTILFVSLAGFYVVKNAIERDRQTGVGQILAATRMGKWQYLLAKCLSNFAVLLSILAVQAVAACVMQWTGAEDPRVDLWKILSPFLFLAAPAMFFLAALAVLFESIRPLSGGLGNVVYFFTWPFFLWLSLESEVPALDIFSVHIVQADIQTVVKAQFPAYDGGFSINAGGFQTTAMQTFLWNGFHWTAAVIGQRLLPIAYALVIILIAALCFDRFEHAPRMHRIRSFRGFRGLAALGEWIDGVMALRWIAPRSQFGRMLMAELRLMLKGVSVWWYVVALGLWIVSLSVPIGDLREWGVPVLSLLPILIWSNMGIREERFGTGPLIFSTPRALMRQLPALWLAGVVLTAGLFSGAWMRFLLSGDYGFCAIFCISIAFIPAFALACGIWSRSAKLFEALYLVLWYIGPLHHVAPLDYTFTSPASLTSGMPLWYYLLTALLLGSAVIGRRRQIAGMR